MRQKRSAALKAQGQLSNKKSKKDSEYNDDEMVYSATEEEEASFTDEAEEEEEEGVEAEGKGNKSTKKKSSKGGGGSMKSTGNYVRKYSLNLELLPPKLFPLSYWTECVKKAAPVLRPKHKYSKNKRLLKRPPVDITKIYHL